MSDKIPTDTPLLVARKVPASERPPKGCKKIPIPWSYYWMMFCTLDSSDGPIRAWEAQFDQDMLAQEPLGGIALLLGPQRWLLENGTAESLANKLGVIQQAERIVTGQTSKRDLPEANSGRFLIVEEQDSALPKSLVPPLRFVLQDESVRDLSRFMEYLGWQREISIVAERYLEAHGWRFDPMSGKIVAIDKHKGRNLLTLCIVALAIEFGRDAKGREKIRDYLSPIFAAELNIGRRGNIARALENARRRR